MSTLACFRLTASVFNTSSEFPWSGFKEKDTGFTLDLGIEPAGTKSLKHNLQYEAVIRNISSSRQTSIKVREQCGPHLKSALRHICSIDKRDDTIFPTSGSFMQFTTEIAGLGGNIGFVKNEFNMQSNWSPIDFAVIIFIFYFIH